MTTAQDTATGPTSRTTRITMDKRRWVVKRRPTGIWEAYPEDHSKRLDRGWLFFTWQDAMDYANSNGRRVDIPRTQSWGGFK
jgi:hypothetical protein